LQCCDIRRLKFPLCILIEGVAYLSLPARQLLDLTYKQLPSGQGSFVVQPTIAIAEVGNPFDMDAS